MSRRVLVWLTVLACLVVLLPAVGSSSASKSTQAASSYGPTQQVPSEQTETAGPYPSNTTRQNEESLDAYSTGGDNFSARPSQAHWESCCELTAAGSDGPEPLFTDAYVEVFSIGPSTIVHTRNGTQRYGSPNGTVRVVSNYRVTPPGNESSEPGTPEQNLTRTSSEVQLLVNGTVVDSSTSATPRLQYRGISGVRNLTVWMSLEGTVAVGNDSNATERRNYSMTVTDSELIRVQNLSAMAVTHEYGWVNDSRTVNESALTLSVPGLWHEAEFDAGPVVHSQWYYYTKPAENWTRWNNTSTRPDSGTPAFTPIAPVEVHAVPVTAGPELFYSFVGNRTDFSSGFRPTVRLEYPESELVPQPSLPEDVELDRAGASTTADRFTLRSRHSLQEIDEVTIHGIVRGRSVTHSIDSTDPVTSRELNLTAREVRSTDETTQLLVHADQKEGGWVKQGHISVETDESRVERELTWGDFGEIVVTLPQSEVRSAEIRYRPEARWWNQSRVYPVRETSITYANTVGLPPFDAIIDFVVAALLWIVPLGLLLYGFDMVTRGKILKWYQS